MPKVRSILAKSALALGVSGTAGATMIDLTSVDAQGSIDGAILRQFTFGPAGSGVIDSFVAYGGHDAITEGYNTDGRSVQYDENSSPIRTRSIRRNDVPLVDIAGVNYREFLFDINERSSGNNPLLSLDRLEVYIAGSGSLLHHPTFDGSTTRIYDLDAGGDNWVMLDAGLSGSGSGKADMLFYLPDALFASAYGADPYVYLYSQVGAQGAGNNGLGNSGGFEEWARSTQGPAGPYGTPTPPPPPPPPPPPQAPEPGTLLLVAGGAFGLRLLGRARR